MYIVTAEIIKKFLKEVVLSNSTSQYEETFFSVDCWYIKNIRDYWGPINPKAYAMLLLQFNTLCEFTLETTGLFEPNFLDKQKAQRDSVPSNLMYKVAE